MRVGSGRHKQLPAAVVAAFTSDDLPPYAEGDRHERQTGAINAEYARVARFPERFEAASAEGHFNSGAEVDSELVVGCRSDNLVQAYGSGIAEAEEGITDDGIYERGLKKA